MPLSIAYHGDDLKAFVCDQRMKLLLIYYIADDAAIVKIPYAKVTADKSAPITNP